MSTSILDRPPQFAELFEPALLTELCAAFGDLYRLGLRAFDDRHEQLVEVNHDAGLGEKLFHDPVVQRAMVDFISGLKRLDPERGESLTRVDPVAGTRYLIVPVVYEFEVIGKLICGPYLPETPPPLAESPYARRLDLAAVERARSRLTTFGEAGLRARVAMLLKAIETTCHSGYKALLTSNMHLESITEAYNDLQAANQQLRERNEALAASNARLRELDELKSNFLATVSHELRTPLTSVIGYSEMLYEELAGPLNDEQKEYLATIMERGESLLQLIGGILDISKIERGVKTLSLERVTVEAIVEAALSTVRPQARKGQLALVVDISEGLPVLNVDRYKVRQSLVNLLSNAVKFTSAGGSVTVRVRPSIAPRAGHGGADIQAVRFSVQDTGVGLPADQLGKVFDAFYQVDNSSTRSYGGTGLGLSIVKNFVEAHGGEVFVESEEGAGATFSFVVPVDQPGRAA